MVQPGVVGVMTAVLVTPPEVVAVPVMVHVTELPAGRVAVPETIWPVVATVQVAPPVGVQIGTSVVLSGTLAGTSSVMVAVPAPLPVLVTVTV